MNLDANLTRFTGFADIYDRCRPAVPVVVADILSQLAGAGCPKLVVDIGCGTGLSSRIWAGRADRVIGIEPNADMRRQAKKAAKALGIKGITYREGTSTRTGLPNACADVVTCVRSLHWMNPKPTFAEIARILRPGGVFAACDSDGQPTITWEIEEAYRAFRAVSGRLEEKLGVSRAVRKWAKVDHLARMKASGRFRLVKELFCHHIEPGDADRLVGLAMSMSGVAALLKHGLSEEQIGLAALREAARRHMGRKAVPWYFSYRLRVAVK